MANPAFDDDNDKPLDPAVRRVEVRVRRLMLIGGLTLAVGIFAVFAAILYRIAAVDTTPAALAPGAAVALAPGQLGLPADAKLISTALDGNRLALTYAAATGTLVVVVDLSTGAVVRRLTIAP